MMSAVPVQLGNSFSEPWPPHNSGMWRIHSPMYCWYMTCVKKELRWQLTYPEVFLHHSVWTGGWQTPKHTGTLPCVPWVIYWWKGAYSENGYFRCPAIIPGPCNETVPQWVLIAITPSQRLLKGGMNVVEASSLSGRSEEKRVSWNNPVPLMGTVLCPSCVDPLCSIWWTKDILKALLQSHNLAKRSSKMRRQQCLSSIAEQLQAVLRHGPLSGALVLQKGMYATGGSETVKPVLSEL